METQWVKVINRNRDIEISRNIFYSFNNFIFSKQSRISWPLLAGGSAKTEAGITKPLFLRPSSCTKQKGLGPE